MQEEYLKEGLKIIKTLNAYTYQAYIVGGAVRDYLLQNEFVDIDIATSATPDELAKIFPARDLKMEYSNLGCVILKQNGYSFEISTFKTEVYNEKGKVRIPNNVYYSEKLIDDVARRDFTINAIALTDNMQVVDLVGGVKDLHHKKIRIIGKAKKRFKEDPLRILRAYELVSRFNFNIAYGTSLGIVKTNNELRAISNHQLSKAMDKIFEGLYGKKAVRLMVQNHTNLALDDYADGLYLIAKHYAKLNIIEKYVLCFAYKNMIPNNTSFDKVKLAKISELLNLVNKTKDYTKDDYFAPQDLIKYGIEEMASAIKINHLMRKDYPNLNGKLKAMYRNMTIKTLRDLKIKGNDIVALNDGKKGKYVGQVIDELASEVALNILQNNYTELTRRAKEIISQMDAKEEVVEEKIEEVTTEVTPVELPNSLTNDEIDLIGLKIKYDLVFNEQVEKTTKLFVSESSSDEEKEALLLEIKQKVQDAILEQNPEYQILKERGLLK